MEHKHLTEKSKATIEIFAGIILLGTGPMFVKFVRANGVQVAFYRLLFAAVMLAVPALLVRRRQPRIENTQRQVGWLIAGGAVFALNIALWSSALNYTSTAVVTLLDNTAPIWVGAFSWLALRHRQGRVYWIGLCLAVVGGVLLVLGEDGGGGSAHPLGVLLSVFSGLTYAAYILITERARKYHTSMAYSWMVSVIGAGVLLIFGLLSGAFAQPLPVRSFLLIFLMSLSSQVLGWLLVNDALGKLPAAAGSVALVGQPVVTTLLGIIVLGELLNPRQWLGAVGCLAGILLAQRRTGAA